MRATVCETVGPECPRRSEMRARSGTMFSSSRSRIVRRYISVVSMRSVIAAVLPSRPARQPPSGCRRLSGEVARALRAATKRSPRRSAHAELVIPTSTPARRRTFRLRPLQGAARAARAPRRRSAPQLLGTSHRQAPVKELVGRVRTRPRRPLLACPRATRSCSATADRPRSGTPRPSASSSDARSSARSASSARSSPRPRRRPVARGARRAQGDRRDPRASPSPSRASTSTPGRTTRRPPASWHRSPASHGDDGALTVIDATSAAGGIDCRRRRVRRLLLRPAEELRLRRRHLVRADLARRDRARRAHRRERPVHPRVPLAEERRRQLAPRTRR